MPPAVQLGQTAVAATSPGTLGVVWWMMTMVRGQGRCLVAAAALGMVVLAVSGPRQALLVGCFLLHPLVAPLAAVMVVVMAAAAAGAVVAGLLAGLLMAATLLVLATHTNQSGACSLRLLVSVCCGSTFVPVMYVAGGQPPASQMPVEKWGKIVACFVPACVVTKVVCLWS